jgi:hypothetical protein
MFLKILTVAALATFEIYAAIPAGFAMGLSPWVIFFASITGVWPVYLLPLSWVTRSGHCFIKTSPPKRVAEKKHPGSLSFGINMASLDWDFWDLCGWSTNKYWSRHWLKCKYQKTGYLVLYWCYNPLYCIYPVGLLWLTNVLGLIFFG